MSSSAIKSIGYEASVKILEVEFHSGRVYQYRGVQKELYDWLMRVPGKGGLLNRMIVGKFEEEDVTEVPPEEDLSELLARSLKPQSSVEPPSVCDRDSEDDPTSL